MREVKFRAWHLAEKKMWADVGTNGYGSIILDTEYRGLQALRGEAVLMQYTGLKDKNGKEIYEGDIIRPKVGKPRKVIWMAGRFMYANPSKRGVKLPLYPQVAHAKEFEVIGNIYQNPELLEQKVV